MHQAAIAGQNVVFGDATRLQSLVAAGLSRASALVITYPDTASAKKILHLVREPMDVCFSNWRALFGDAYAYSYDFESLARHHAQYRRLMAHWHRVHPGFVLDVPYANLVNDTETICRRVLAFCGLPFEADCLDHTRNRSSVSTLSSAQVREPIHARGIGEWRRYATPLEPLRRLLEA